MVWKEEYHTLQADYEFDDFKSAIKFINQLADVCEKLEHHPEILLHDWNWVRITTTTHDEGNKITEKDRELTREVDALVGA